MDSNCCVIGMSAQVCNHPYLLPGVDPMETDERLVEASSKLRLLDRLLARLRAAGRRVLVYSQFTSMLDVLGDYLSLRGHRFESRRDGPGFSGLGRNGASEPSTALLSASTIALRCRIQPWSEISR